MTAKDVTDKNTARIIGLGSTNKKASFSKCRQILNRPMGRDVIGFTSDVLGILTTMLIDATHPMGIFQLSDWVIYINSSAYTLDHLSC